MIPKDAIESRAAFDKLQAVWRKLTRPVNILLVEDDVRDIELIKHAISGRRVDVCVALTGSEAKQRIEQDDYDLCLLDLRLVDISGVEIIKWAKEARKPLPFIVLTGMSDGSPMIQEALTAGAECAFQKPLTPDNVKMMFGAI